MTHNANLVVHRDPFRVHLNVEQELVATGISIWDVLAGKDLVRPGNGKMLRNGAFVVLLNGSVLLESHWNTILQADDVVQVSMLPKGGGGGSTVGNIIAGIIVAVMAFFTFGLSLVAAAAWGLAVTGVLSLMGGTAAAPSTSLGASGRESTSPTYSLNAQGNQARLLESIPRIYGKVKMYPDLAAQPYSEFKGNAQYIYQLFCVSLGSVQIHDVMVDGNSLADFEDAEYEVIEPHETVTLFPDNVVTSDAVSSIEMPAPNNPGYMEIGPFIAVPVGQKANFLAVDVVFPRGIGEVSQETGKIGNRTVSFTFDCRQINDAGAPQEPWRELKTVSITSATMNPQFVSYKVAVPLGRYEVKGYRMSDEQTTGRAFDTVQWAALRGYMKSTRVYGNVTLVAVIMKATNTLNSSTARKFSVLATGKVQKWDPVNGWGALVADRNPAWAAADILRNVDYGRGLGTTRINVAKLYQLAALWQSRGDTFNGVFDTTVQLWDALSKVLRVGRATPMYYAGVIDFVRDGPQTVVKAMVQPSNMIAGSFETVYNFFDNDSPDHVVVEYTNEVTWDTDTVTCVLPGSTQRNPAKVELFGCTNRDQAWREGITMAAANRDRRRNISFTMEKDGLIPSYLSLIRVSHDTPAWGFSGRCLSLDRVTGVLRTSEPIVFGPGSYAIAFRKRDGSEHGPFTIQQVPEFDVDRGEYGCRVVASAGQLAGIYISNGHREDLTAYQAGPTTRRGILCLVKSAQPDSNGQVTVNCINYAENVNLAETGGIVPPPNPESNLPTVPSAPIVDSVQVLYTVTVGMQNIVATPARGAIYYEYQARVSGNTFWQNLGTSSESTLVAFLSPNEWDVRVRAVGQTAGPWASWTGEIEATTIPTPRLVLFTASKMIYGIGLQWAYDPDMLTITKSVEIWEGITDSLGDAVKLIELPYPANAHNRANLAAGEQKYYWARCIDTAGRVGPWYNNGIVVAQIAENDASIYTEVLTGQIDSSMLATELREEIEGGGDAMVAVEALTSQLAAMYTIKTQLTVDGKPYMAAIGVGVENDEGVITSQVLIAADRFAVISPDTGETGALAPFIIDSGQVFMNSAFIKDGTITNAKIGSFIQSDNYVAGQTGWRINKSGSFEMNGTVAGQGRVTITAAGVRIYDGSNRLRVKLGNLA